MESGRATFKVLGGESRVKVGYDDRSCLRHQQLAARSLSSSAVACSLLVSTAVLYLSSQHNTPSPTPSP